jgi:hypothetical protein
LRFNSNHGPRAVGHGVGVGSHTTITLGSLIGCMQRREPGRVHVGDGLQNQTRYTADQTVQLQSIRHSVNIRFVQTGLLHRTRMLCHIIWCAVVMYKMHACDINRPKKSQSGFGFESIFLRHGNQEKNCMETRADKPGGILVLESIEHQTKLINAGN